MAYKLWGSLGILAHPFDFLRFLSVFVSFFIYLFIYFERLPIWFIWRLMNYCNKDIGYFL